jgi:predicted MFS family arabinose efflux permease
MVGFTIGNALIPLAPSGALLLGAAFLIGQQLIGDSAATVYEILEVSLVQSSVGNRVLGRVNATINTFTTLLTLVGVVGGGVIAELYGLRAAFVTGLMGAVVAILIIWFSPVRHLRDAPVSIEPVAPGEDAPLP